ncbi:MAG: protein kinase [Acidobacteriota bacterium]
MTTSDDTRPRDSAAVDPDGAETGRGSGGERRVGPYRLGERLGAGGMGEVFKGFDVRLERPVALKNVLAGRQESAVARRRLLREARAMAKVHHPSIAQIHDWVEAEDGDWFVMELVTGSTLRQVIDGKGALPWRRAAALGAEIAEGLEAAHAAGLVHRDLKPANVMVTPAGRAKILDFGLAKGSAATPPTDAPAFDDDLSATGAGQLIGTVSAMSPEQALGLPVDARTDLFALGILLYELVTAVSPFRAENAVSTLARICNREAEPLETFNPDLPPAFSELVLELLAKEKDQRPVSAESVAHRLRGLLGESRAERTAEPTGGAGPVGDGSSQRVTRDFSSSGRRSSERRLMALAVLELASDDPDDDEILLEEMPAFQALVDELASVHGGHIESRTGHRVVLCFGHPIASADDALRSVRLAVEAVRRVRGDLEEVRARVALHAGPVLLLVEGEREILVLGTTLERAQALISTVGSADAEAPPIVASGEVERLTRDVYDWGPVDAPGHPSADLGVFHLLLMV